MVRKTYPFRTKVPVFQPNHVVENMQQVYACVYKYTERIILISKHKHIPVRAYVWAQSHMHISILGLASRLTLTFSVKKPKLTCVVHRQSVNGLKYVCLELVVSPK